MVLKKAAGFLAVMLLGASAASGVQLHATGRASHSAQLKSYSARQLRQAEAPSPDQVGELAAAAPQALTDEQIDALVEEVFADTIKEALGAAAPVAGLAAGPEAEQEDLLAEAIALAIAAAPEADQVPGDGAAAGDGARRKLLDDETGDREEDDLPPDHEPSGNEGDDTPPEQEPSGDETVDVGQSGGGRKMLGHWAA